METKEEQLIGLSAEKLKQELDRLKELGKRSYTISAIGSSSLAISTEFEEIEWSKK